MKQINGALKTLINWQISTKTEKEEKRIHKLTISGMKRVVSLQILQTWNSQESSKGRFFTSCSELTVS